jgi:hypothetical protein
MKLAAAELSYVRSQGLYVTEKCDQCGKLLNQAVRYTITGKPEVYCSAECRELAFFRDRREARKHATPGKCVYCNAELKGKRRGALYCDETCKKYAVRRRGPLAPARPELSGTPAKPNEPLTDGRIGG